MATVQLFKLLLNKDASKEIIKKAIKTDNSRKLAPKLLGILDDLPTKTGVFYVHNCSSQILYMGKAKNIQKEVNNLFLRNSKKSRDLQDKVVSVTYRETGNELIAQLLFAQELENNKPRHNYPLRKKYEPVKFSNENMLIIDRGRNVGEKSVLLIEEDEFKGFCYTDLEFQVNNHEVLTKLISKMENSEHNRHLISKYLLTKRVEKIIRF